MTPNLTTRQRAWAIAQLCVAFSLILWHLFYPFTGYYAALESQRLLYRAVMGEELVVAEQTAQRAQTTRATQMMQSQPDELHASAEAKRQRNRERFLALPQEQAAAIAQRYEQLQRAGERSALSKLADSVERLLWQLPPFEIAWLLFSGLIALLILLRWEGATQAAWLLPLLVVGYIADGQLRGQGVGASAVEALFPSESYLTERYLDQPLTGSLSAQKQQLERAWQRYLVVEWAKEAPSSQTERFNAQVEAGEHAFYISWIAALPKVSTAPKLEKPNPLVAALYLTWNLCFAYGVRYRRLKRPLEASSSLKCSL